MVQFAWYYAIATAFFQVSFGKSGISGISVSSAMQKSLPSLLIMGAAAAVAGDPLSVYRVTEPGPYQTDLVVMDTKLAIIEILQVWRRSENFNFCVKIQIFWNIFFEFLNFLLFSYEWVFWSKYSQLLSFRTLKNLFWFV